MAADAVINGGVVIHSPAQGVVIVGRLQVPPPLATGRYEHLTDEELNEHAADINAELERRSNAAVS